MFKNKDSQKARQKTCANTHGQGLNVGSVQRFVKINPVLVSISEETPARDSSSVVVVVGGNVMVVFY